MRILNFGSLNLDYTYQVDRICLPGETKSARSLTVQPGGKGLNQSVAMAWAGAEVYHAGCLGVGGEMLRQVLWENGVEDSFLLETEEPQGTAVIQVEESGENSILVYGGSNRCVSAEQVSETLAQFGPGDWLVLQNEISCVPELVDQGAARGLQIILNPSPWDESLAPVDFGKLSWLVCNRLEAQQISGEETPEKCWETLHARYPKLSLLITLGKEGSVAFSGDQILRQQAFPAHAVDTTGAGDTYTGYFAAGLAAGRPLQACMAEASMASAISVERPGAAPSIPAREEVLRRLEELS